MTEIYVLAFLALITAGCFDWGDAQEPLAQFEGGGTREPGPVESRGEVPGAGAVETPGLPIEVTYLTPPQGEGPYYPVEKPADRDNDLTLLSGASGVPAGDVLAFMGTVYDETGWPVKGVLLEIWQTDAGGVYLHPRDPGTANRDPNFQFYGEVLTDENGHYAFRTILPGHYEPRPRHIHVKIKFDGDLLLTTQFYFTNDPELADEAMFAQVGDAGRHLVIVLQAGTDAQGNPVLTGVRDVILAGNYQSASNP